MTKYVNEEKHETLSANSYAYYKKYNDKIDAMNNKIDQFVGTKLTVNNLV